MYTVGDAQRDMSPVGDGQDRRICGIHSEGRSVTHVHSGG